MQGSTFISYSRRDLDKVNPIKVELERNGLSCWMDVQDVSSGDDFAERIAAGIEGSDTVLFFLSDSSQRSRYSLNELRAARDSKKHVVLIRFNNDAMTTKFKLEFGGTDIIDWRQPEQKKKLLRDLRRWTGIVTKSQKNSALVATALAAAPRMLGERLIKSLDEELDWRQFRAIAGLEFHGGNGSMRAHVVGSPWGVFIVGYDDLMSADTSVRKICIPTEMQVHAYKEKIVVATELQPDWIKFLFAVREPLLKKLRASRKRLPEFIKSEEEIKQYFNRFQCAKPVLDWEKYQWDITRKIESLPMINWGREANIIKHFNAKTVEEVEAGAALLAWVVSPSEELLDAAELACYYLRENGCRRAVEGVKVWFRVVADRGSVLAMDHYGWLLDGSDGEWREGEMPEAVKKSLADSVDKERVWWFKKGAEGGGAHAQNSLGHCLQTGRGVHEDRVEALKCFRASAEKGNRFGQNSLADLLGPYADPIFLPQDWNEAFRLYRLSAEQGYDWAQYHLGECYENGHGTARNLLEARRWYEKAAVQLNEYAQAALERIRSVVQ